MSFYICRQCASGQALRRATAASAATFTPNPSLLAQSLLSSSRRGNLFPSLSARALTSSAPQNPLIQPTRIKTSRATATKPSSSSSKSRIPPPPRLRKPLPKREHESLSPVDKIHRYLDHHIQQLHVDLLYLKFWKICATESLDFQRQIWSAAAGEQDSSQDRPKDPSQPQFKDLSPRHRFKYGQGARRMESFYRAFNSPAQPRNSDEPPLLDSGERCPWVLQFPTIPPPSSLGSKTITKSSSGIPAMMTMHFMTGSSHPKRLLQIHQYLESVLGVQVDYYARIALLVAFSSEGDIVTVQGLFDEWRDKGRINAGKEMYSAIIHGLVGNNSRDQTPHGLRSDAFGGTGSRTEFRMTSATSSTTLRNGRVTQMYAALELFYDLLRRGGTPTYEIYHSLIVGMACFKNDLEAAELLLDHMLMTRKKPYVQVLHVMCREYTRQRNFAGAERIFWMLREYGIKPKPLTCNVMLKAIFQTSTIDALEYIADHPYGPKEDGLLDQTLDSEQLVLNWKRQKVRELRDYMQETNTAPDSVTYSTLFYGYGHMKDGYPDLRATLVEMVESSKIEPNLVVLSSLLFAHLNHEKLEISESLLDEMLLRARQGQGSIPISTQAKEQLPSPFKKVLDPRPTPIKEPSAYRTPLPLYPPKGVFHALMLAYVEHRDIGGMERILDKLIRAQLEQHSLVRELARSSEGIVESDLEADEFTANIMLLGYASQGDLEKAEMIQSQILSRPDWKRRHLFWERESSREELLAYVRQQGSKEQVRNAVLLSPDEPLSSTVKKSPAVEEKGEFDPTHELADDIEIDVATLAAKLKNFQKSIPTAKSLKS